MTALILISIYLVSVALCIFYNRQTNRGKFDTVACIFPVVNTIFGIAGFIEWLLRPIAKSSWVERVDKFFQK